MRAAVDAVTTASARLLEALVAAGKRKLAPPIWEELARLIECLGGRYNVGRHVVGQGERSRLSADTRQL
jgi:hypothetical protein